jgi:hypothetical protein
MPTAPGVVLTECLGDYWFNQASCCTCLALPRQEALVLAYIEPYRVLCKPA